VDIGCDFDLALEKLTLRLAAGFRVGRVEKRVWARTDQLECASVSEEIIPLQSNNEVRTVGAWADLQSAEWFVN
jgi:hypothetical protein